MQFSKPRNRREFMKLAALGVAGSAIAAACAPPVAPAAPTTAPAAAPKPADAKPTEAPKAAAAAPTTAPAASKSAKKITFANDWNSGVRADTIKASVAEYNKRHPEVVVEALQMGPGVGTSSVGGFSEQIVAMFVGGQTPDLVFSWIEIVGTHRNFLVDLTPLVKASNYSSLGIVEVPTNTHWEGKQYGINFAPGTGGWLYNRTMFEKAGVALPTDNWTWDDALEAMKKLTKPAEKQWGFWSYNYVEYGYLPMLWCNGGKYFADDTLKKVVIGEAPSLEAFQWWVDLIYKHKVSPGTSYHSRAQDRRYGRSLPSRDGRDGSEHPPVRWRRSQVHQGPLPMGTDGLPQGPAHQGPADTCSTPSL